MNKRFLSLVAIFVLLFGVIGSAQAVPWGVPDGYGHPQVVTLLFQRPDGYYSCSGTLLTQYVVLTAGHCTEENGQVNIATWVRNDPDIDAAYATERPNYPSLQAWLADKWISAQAVPHPQYADFDGFPNTHDVGVALLSRALPVAQYGQLPTLGQFNFLDTSRGSNQGDRRFTIVGYGLQAQVPVPRAQSDWVRYVGQVTLTNTRNQYTDGYNFQFSNNPGQGNGSGGTCFGDSGGPAFWGSTNTIAAVTSFGKTKYCTGNSYSFRVDTADALNFVTPYLGWVPS